MSVEQNTDPIQEILNKNAIGEPSQPTTNTQDYMIDSIKRTIENPNALEEFVRDNKEEINRQFNEEKQRELLGEQVQASVMQNRSLVEQSPSVIQPPSVVEHSVQPKEDPTLSELAIPQHLATLSELADAKPLPETIPSPTSVDSEVHREGVHIIPTSPKLSNTLETHTVYHVVLDSEFSFDDLPQQKGGGIMYGGFRRELKGRIPVLFNLEDAENLAKNIIELYHKLGSLNDKQFLVFGVVILYIDTHGVVPKHITVGTLGGKFSHNDLEEQVNGLTDNLITYDRVDPRYKEKTRGVLNRSVNKIFNCKYILDSDPIPDKIGYALLNSANRTSGDSVRLLKRLKDDPEHTLKHAPSTSLELIRNQTGGKINYERLYRQKKREYLELKKRKR